MKKLALAAVLFTALSFTACKQGAEEAQHDTKDQVEDAANDLATSVETGASDLLEVGAPETAEDKAIEEQDPFGGDIYDVDETEAILKGK